MTRLKGTRCSIFKRAVVICALIIVSVAVSGQKLMGQPVTHPLDPLTVGEYAAAVALLKAADYVNNDSRYPMITLHEPVKSEVLRVEAWRPPCRGQRS